jgi:hypothetical protein
MTEIERKRCVRCERPIDGGAKVCPFCNWDQNEAAPRTATQAEAETQAAYNTPPEHRFRKIVFSGVGLAVLLITAFALGSMIHGANPEETAAKTGGSIVSQTAAPEPEATRHGPQSNVKLVPVTDSSPIVEQPITSAPAPNAEQGVPTEYQRSDATAVSSAEYQQLAARAKAEKQSMVVDPRSIGGGYRGSVPRPRPAAPPPSAAAATTPPEPESQPIPEIHVDHTTTVRLLLTIGADGHVRNVTLDGGIPGQTAKLIAAVQGWRFKPAMQNGVPVPAPYSTAVSFHVDE